MGDMDEFHRKVQMLLMKKSREYGELRFLSSRTTEESTKRIEDICTSVKEVFQACGIPIEGKDLVACEECVQAYKYLVLNTSFQNQERMGEDMIHGHLVDMCPPLSPYLFIEILWAIKYEKILSKSLLYFPLDLCTELLEILRKCIEELPFERSFEILFEIISNVYHNVVCSKDIGVQSTDLTDTIERLLANFQEFLLLLSNPKVIRLNELTDLKKYERYGILLKRLIGTIKNCLESEMHGGPPIHHLEKLYKITFGRETFVKYENTLIEHATTSLNQELMNLLLKKVKEIDCNIYLGWVELDDTDNNKISLQRAIGNEFYFFVELLKNDDRLSQDNHLIECLQQLSSKPDANQSGYVLTLGELCDAIKEGKTESIKELMNRYREWDRPTLDFINKNRSLLDKDDCVELLEYLTFTVKHSDQEDWKQFCYSLVMKVLFLRSIPDIYEVVMEYITKHDGQNYLESEHTREAFDEFIKRNSHLRTPTNLRMILLFLLKNPRMVLTELLKITIGHPSYENILISANDLLLLSPFMSIREEGNQILLTSLLRTICMENAVWNPKKFLDFVRMITDSNVIKVDDLMNNVFIPYLNGDVFNTSNISSVLTNVRKLQGRCTKNMNVKDLVVALAKRMSSVRSNNDLSKSTTSEILSQITRALEYVLNIKGTKMSNRTKNEIIAEIERFIEPIDKLHFAPLWYLSQKGISVVDVLQDYERRCSIVVNKLKEDPRSSERLRNHLSDLSFLMEDFLRHLILRSTETEYHKLALEYSTVYWFVFGCNNEIEACDHVLRVTIEACCLLLEYPSIGKEGSLLELLKCFVRFCKTFVRIEGLRSFDEVYHSLVKNITSLSTSIRQSPYAHLFEAFLARLNNDLEHDSERTLQELLNMLDGFVGQCFALEYGEKTHTSPSPKISRCRATHQNISACIKVPATEAYECMRRLNELFAPS